MGKHFIFSVLAVFLIFTSGCGSGFRHATKAHHFKAWNKAFCLAQDGRRAWTYGESWGQSTEKEAIDKAFLNCEQSRTQQGVSASCVLYSVNSRVVYGQNYTPKSPERGSPERAAPEQASPGQKTKKSACGTGFAVNEDGVIVTSYHVIKDGKSIRIQLQDGTVSSAKVLKISPNIDIAILKVDRPTPNYLAMDSLPEIGVGDRVFTLGFPVEQLLGQELKFTDGSISALSGIMGEATFLQITVPIQPGNSGGPLLSEDGKVVGVIAATIAVKAFLEQTHGALPQNINYAVSGSFVAPLVSPYKKEIKDVNVSLTRREMVEEARKAVLKVIAE
jgi:S1-C subfamily serine protease